MTKKPYFAYRSFRREFETMRRFADIGVKQFCLFAGNTTNSLGEPYNEYPPIWKWYEAYDFAPFDRQLEDLLQISPDAQILCMVDLNSPLWMTRQRLPDSFLNLSNAEADARWRDYTAKYLEAFVKHAEARCGDRILAYILMCGQTDEWMDSSYGIETREKTEAYREWSRKNGLPVPLDAPTERLAHEATLLGGDLRDPVAQADAIRYWRFHSDLNVQTIEFFANKTRALITPDKEIGVFFGYILELGNWGVVQCAHLAYEKLEASGAIDFFISPGDYHYRAMGQGSGFMLPNGTIHRYGKNCLYEIDHRTHTANMQLTPYVSLVGQWRWKDNAEDVAGLRREFCRTLFHGASLWWFDMWGGFYDEEVSRNAIARCREIWERHADRSFEPDAEIALIVDPENMYLVNDRKDFANFLPIFHDVLNRLGTPHRIYSLNDLPYLPKEIKVVLFAGLFQITPETQKLLEEHVFGKKSCIWCGPNAILGENLELPGTFLPKCEDVTPDALRKVASAAGVHFYVAANTPVWAGRNLVSVHTAEGGKVTVHLRQKAATVTELFSGKVVAENTSTFDYVFSTPDTVLFETTC